MEGVSRLHVRGRRDVLERTVDLDRPLIRIGRGVECEVRLLDAVMADVQAMLRKRDDGWWLQPVGPSGRIWRGSDAIEESTPILPGEAVRVGAHWLTLELGDPVPAETPAQAPSPAPPKVQVPAQQVRPQVQQPMVQVQAQARPQAQAPIRPGVQAQIPPRPAAAPVPPPPNRVPPAPMPGRVPPAPPKNGSHLAERPKGPAGVPRTATAPPTPGWSRPAAPTTRPETTSARWTAPSSAPLDRGRVPTANGYPSPPSTARPTPPPPAAERRVAAAPIPSEASRPAVPAQAPAPPEVIAPPSPREAVRPAPTPAPPLPRKETAPRQQQVPVARPKPVGFASTPPAGIPTPSLRNREPIPAASTVRAPETAPRKPPAPLDRKPEAPRPAPIGIIPISPPSENGPTKKPTPAPPQPVTVKIPISPALAAAIRTNPPVEPIRPVAEVAPPRLPEATAPVSAPAVQQVAEEEAKGCEDGPFLEAEIPAVAFDIPDVAEAVPFATPEIAAPTEAEPITPIEPDLPIAAPGLPDYSHAPAPVAATAPAIEPREAPAVPVDVIAEERPESPRPAPTPAREKAPSTPPESARRVATTVEEPRPKPALVPRPIAAARAEEGLWPSAQDILKAWDRNHPRPAVSERPQKRPTPAPAPTQLTPPKTRQWPVFPITWGAAALIGVVGGGIGCGWAFHRAWEGGQASIWTAELVGPPGTDQAIRVGAALNEVDPPAQGWLFGDSQRQGQYATALQIAGTRAPERIGQATAWSENAARSTPIEPATQWAEQMERSEPAGLPREVPPLLWAAKEWAAAGKLDEALKAYRRALALATGPHRDDLPPDWDGRPTGRRYLLPREREIAAIVAALSQQKEWDFTRWREALPQSSIAWLVAARILKESGRPEADEAIDRVVALANTTKRAMEPREVRLAAAAEANMLRHEFQEAEQLYLQALQAAPDGEMQRSWWINLSEVYYALNQDAKRSRALDRARGPSVGDEITKRATKTQMLLRPTGTELQTQSLDEEIRTANNIAGPDNRETSPEN